LQDHQGAAVRQTRNTAQLSNNKDLYDSCLNAGAEDDHKTQQINTYVPGKKNISKYHSLMR
jgi:hypothetical protein